MPRSVRETLEHSDQVAKRFENYEPSPEDRRDPEAYLALRRAAETRADAERSVVNAVRRARDAKYSWQIIGSLLGTSGEAARQRYGAEGSA